MGTPEDVTSGGPISGTPLEAPPLAPWNALSAGPPCARSSLKDTQPRGSKALLRTSAWHVQLNRVQAPINC